MDNTIYVGLSRQMILERELDITSNNLANVDTVGFKFESMINNDDPVTMPTPGVAPTTVNFVADGGVARDFTQGGFTRTGASISISRKREASVAKRSGSSETNAFKEPSVVGIGSNAVSSGAPGQRFLQAARFPAYS